MIQKLHHFEIAQIYQDTYVQYLHLLSQITVNTLAIEEVGKDQESAVDKSTSFTGNADFLIKNIHFFSEKCIKEDQRKKLLNSTANGQRNMIYQFFFINYLLSVCIVDVVRKAHKNAEAESRKPGGRKDAAESAALVGERSISQRIFIILIKLLEALGDNELNQSIDQALTARIETYDRFNEHQRDTQGRLGEPATRKKPEPPAAGKSGRGANSATMTIRKMILFNLDRLLRVSKQVQDQSLAAARDQPPAKPDNAEVLTHRMQTIHLDEDQLALLVRLLTQNEQHGEIVNKVYEIL